MNTSRKTLVLAILIAAAAVSTAGDRASWRQGLKDGSAHYQRGDCEKALPEFKKALATVFTGAAATRADEDLQKLLDDKKTGAKARYELALIYESQGKTKEAVRLLHDALTLVATQNARYLGYKDGCKSCHFKQWKSWKDTKMANAFEVLKPGEAAEIKIKHDLDPKKDYTKDPNCLECHTTGYDMPGGYKIPRTTNYKIRKIAEINQGCSCEVCHGPGSVYDPLHEDVEEKMRKYRPEEFFAVGEFKPGPEVCTRCHNKRSPTVEPDYVFDYDELLKKKGNHENRKLKFRIEEE